MTSKLAPFREKEWKKGLDELDKWMAGKSNAFRKIPVPPVSQAEVKKARHRVGLSRVQFAAALGVNPTTIRFWETGQRNPDGLARKVLRLIAKHPNLAKDLALI